jgi:hypothetical protein
VAPAFVIGDRDVALQEVGRRSSSPSSARCRATRSTSPTANPSQLPGQSRTDGGGHIDVLINNAV